MCSLFCLVCCSFARSAPPFSIYASLYLWTQQDTTRTRNGRSLALVLLTCSGPAASSTFLLMRCYRSLALLSVSSLSGRGRDWISLLVALLGSRPRHVGTRIPGGKYERKPAWGLAPTGKRVPRSTSVSRKLDWALRRAKKPLPGAHLACLTWC
jgi:hypothetical protein